MMTLEQFIASQTGTPRREIFAALKRGHIQVNGKTANSLTQKLDLAKDKVSLAGTVIRKRSDFVYYKFFKPKNVITSRKDPEGRPDLSSYLMRVHEPVVPVGRLDRQTRGLLFLTNDGNLTLRSVMKRSWTNLYLLRIWRV